MLRALNARALRARILKAAWERWHRKQPHNRVRQPVVRDDQGRPVGRGDPVPVPEPPLDPLFCRVSGLPSGRLRVDLLNLEVERGYAVARRPAATLGEVISLPLPAVKVAALYRRACGEQAEP